MPLDLSSDISPLALRYLRDNAAPGAIAGAAERSPLPECAEGTRVSILDMFKSWIEDDSSQKRALWLHGLVGMGKSAIMETVAKTHPTAITATFFFGRNQDRRDSAKYLVPTLAHQIATNVQSLQGPICSVVDNNAFVLDLEYTRQFESLIAMPITNSLPSDSAALIVLIDGLDECKDHLAQEGIINMFLEFALKEPRLRVVFASRPESQIQRTFDDPRFLAVLYKIDMIITAGGGPGGLWPDVRKVFREGFKKIYSLKLVGSNVAEPWPSLEDEKELVRLSSGQMLFVRIVLNLVGAKYVEPTSELEKILDPRRRAAGMIPLDALYTHILSAFPDRDRLLALLFLVVTYRSGFKRFDAILGWRSGQANIILSGLQSLLLYDKQNPGHESVRIAHISFLDFLHDEERSKSYYLHPEKYAGDIIVDIIHRASTQVLAQLGLIIQSSQTPFVDSKLGTHLTDYNADFLYNMWDEYFEDTDAQCRRITLDRLQCVSNEFASQTSNIRLNQPQSQDQYPLFLDCLTCLIYFFDPFFSDFLQDLDTHSPDPSLIPFAKPYKSVLYSFFDTHWAPLGLGQLFPFPFFAGVDEELRYLPYFKPIVSANPWILRPRGPMLRPCILEYYFRSGRVSDAPCCILSAQLDWELSFMTSSFQQYHQEDGPFTSPLVYSSIPMWMSDYRWNQRIERVYTLLVGRQKVERERDPPTTYSVYACKDWPSHLREHQERLCTLPYPSYTNLFLSLTSEDKKTKDAALAICSIAELALQLCSLYDFKLITSSRRCRWTKEWARPVCDQVLQNTLQRLLPSTTPSNSLFPMPFELVPFGMPGHGASGPAILIDPAFMKLMFISPIEECIRHHAHSSCSESCPSRLHKAITTSGSKFLLCIRQFCRRQHICLGRKTCEECKDRDDSGPVFQTMGICPNYSFEFTICASDSDALRLLLTWIFITPRLEFDYMQTEALTPTLNQRVILAGNLKTHFSGGIVYQGSFDELRKRFEEVLSKFDEKWRMSVEGLQSDVQLGTETGSEVSSAEGSDNLEPLGDLREEGFNDHDVSP